MKVFGTLVIILALAGLISGLANDMEITLALARNLKPEVLKCLIKKGERLNQEASNGNVDVADVDSAKSELLNKISSNLYKWFRLRSPYLLFNRVCFPQGCINMGDAGVHP